MEYGGITWLKRNGNAATTKSRVCALVRVTDWVRNRSRSLGSTTLKDKTMTLYFSQKCWGRSCLHLVAALRAGRWRWHLAGIKRESQLAGRPRGRESVIAGGVA